MSELAPVATPVSLRTVASVAYGVVLVASLVWRGIPYDRSELFVWIAAGLVVVTPGDARRRVLAVLRDWLPLLVLLVAYDYSRGAADRLGMPLQADYVIAFDRWLFGEVPTVWLQERLYRAGEVAWWEGLVAVVYASHFVVPFVVPAVLWARDRSGWSAWVRRFVTVTAIGLAGYVLLPTVPPWLAARVGRIDPVRRTAVRGFDVIGLEVAERWLETGRGTVNLVAAMPSLHAAYAMLVAVFLWPRVRSTAWRAVLAGYPLAMAFVLVASGEHYVADVLAGWAVVGVAAAAWSAVEARRRATTPG